MNNSDPASRLCGACGNSLKNQKRYCSYKCYWAHRAAGKTAAVVNRKCAQCGEDFSYEKKSTGTKRSFCSDHCRNLRRNQNMKSQPLCIIEGCKNPRGYASGICNACYCRQRRTGTLDRRAWKHRSLATSGYIMLTSKHAHPLANSNGYIYEHRQVLYDSIGDGPHSCAWCQRTIRWRKGKEQLRQRDALVPDHLNGDKTDNRLSNLVPSCQPCNFKRGAFMAWVMKHKDDPFLWSLYLQARVA